MKRWRNRQILIVTCLSWVLPALAGCNSSAGPPAAPEGALVVQSIQTATQAEATALRVQIRFQVLEGLVELTRAAQQGTAEGQVCRSGACASGRLSTAFAERDCTGVARAPLADTAAGFGAAWLDDGVVGLDICLDPLNGDMDFETAISDGRRRSNVIRIVCAAGGACFAG